MATGRRTSSRRTAIEQAVDDALDDGYRTKDLLAADGDATAVTLVGTKEMARVIGDRIAI